ncbi:NifB/NifX family molybdenum-iron cluster-binding protein [Nautilia sp.]
MRIAFPTNNQKTLSPHIGLAKGFLVVDTITNERFYITNPVMEKIQEEHINLKDLPEGNRGFGTGRIIPPLLAEAGVDVLVADEFGDGMARNLEAEGISYYVTDKKDIEEILKEIKEGDMQTNSAREFSRGYGFSRGAGFGRGRGYGFGRGQGFGRGLGRGYGRGAGCGRGRGFGRGFGFRGGWED